MMGKRFDKANIFLSLNDRLALSFDDVQWIVMRRAGQQWFSISFIGSDKGILRRVLEERGCYPTPEAQIALNYMPWRFLDWLAAKNQARGRAA